MTSVSSDNPISDPAEDSLGRAGAAARFADQILAIDASDGLVVGVLGPWGSGKTSFVNLARRNLAALGVSIVDFNPWMFSGTEQLVDRFFVEVGAQVKLKPGLENLGENLQDYGDAVSGLGWLPIVGTTIERARGIAKLAGKALQRRRAGLGDQRTKLRAALAKLERPIVVILDDIDRLSTAEIREVFKLVRLTASFPNLIYVVAFDRARVEAALADDVSTPGRAYLEKILQLAIDLPVVPAGVLTRQVTDALDAVLDGVDFGNAGLGADWPDVFFDVIRPLVRNVRDVRRYAAAVHGTVRDLGGQVALVDLLALDAVRVFLPDVFRAVANGVEGLTKTFDVGFGTSEDPTLKKQAEALLAAEPAHDDVVRALVERIFPAALRHLGGSNFGSGWKSSWLRERRVAHEHHLRHYLERVASAGVTSFRSAEQLFNRLHDRDALEAAVASINAGDIEDAIAALEAYEDKFTAEHVVPGVTVLLNVLAKIPQRPRQMTGFETRMVVSRVVYRLLKAIDDPVELEAAVRKMLPNIGALGSKLELITDVGHRKGAGHRLVSETAAATLERDWRNDVRSADASVLLAERDVAQVLYRVAADAEVDEPPLVVPDSLEMTAAVVRGSRSETLGNTIGTRTVTRTPRLSWSVMATIFGSDDELHRRVDALLADAPGLCDDETRELVARFRAGWRPDDWGDY